MTAFTESTVEEAALAWLAAVGWQVAHGPDIAPDMPAAEGAGNGHREVIRDVEFFDLDAVLSVGYQTPPLANQPPRG